MVREWAISLGFSLVDQTKMVTAASELARNALEHGGGGTVRLESLNNAARRGLRLTFSDQGAGHRRCGTGAQRRLHHRRRHGIGTGRGEAAGQ